MYRMLKSCEKLLHGFLRLFVVQDEAFTLMQDKEKLNCDGGDAGTNQRVCL